MSAQINLYHARFLKQRDLLTLRHVVLAGTALFAVLAVMAGWAWQEAATQQESAIAAEAQLKSAKEKVAAETGAAAIRKPSPQLIAELESVENLLRRRGESARLLASGPIGSTGGFSDYMRGFARQAQEGLWLTGFAVGAGGNDMEIRGSMLSPAALPDYIRRLGAEKAFQGRNFAALTMNRAERTAAPRPVAQSVALPSQAASPAAATTAATAAAAMPADAPRPIDFVLMPKLVVARESSQ